MSVILTESRVNKAAENSRRVSAYSEMIEQQSSELSDMNQSREFFYLNFREKFSYDSNAIEGNSVTEAETYEILRNHKTIAKKPMKDQAEIIGHAKAFDYLVVEDAIKTPITKDLMLTVHKMILEEDDPIAGRFRHFGEDVGVRDSATGKIHHRGINPIAIRDNLDGLLETYNDLTEDEAVNKFALLVGFHLCFESIHPFCDGNGRTGRLLVNFELIKRGYPPININFTKRQLYYMAFEKPDDYGFMTEIFMLATLDSLAMYRRLHEKFMSGNADKPPIFSGGHVPYRRMIKETLL